MLAHFLVNPDDIRLMGRSIALDGTRHDFFVTLQRGEKFKNLPYALLEAAGGGTLYIDLQKNTAELLQPDDPRLKEQPSYRDASLQNRI